MRKLIGSVLMLLVTVFFIVGCSDGMSSKKVEVYKSSETQEVTRVPEITKEETKAETDETATLNYIREDIESDEESNLDEYEASC